MKRPFVLLTLLFLAAPLLSFAQVCGPGQVACGGQCSNLATDPKNCGGCGNVCPTGQQCTAGSVSCGAGQVACGGQCSNLATTVTTVTTTTTTTTTTTNTTTAPQYCGTSGTVCQIGQTCIAGVCGSASCGPGQVTCGGQCSNVSTDPKNCGACGNVCGSGQSCRNGLCGTTTGAVCGNGIRESGEQCDDGNTSNLDGCSSSCRFEQNQRINWMQLVGTTDSFCARNRLGSQSITSVALPQINSPLSADIAAGTATGIFTFTGLIDLTGTTAQPGIQLGMVGGTPVTGKGYSGTSDLDWWYTVDPTTVSTSGVPLAQVSASIAAKTLTAGPATINLPFPFSKGPATLPVVNATLSVSIGTASVPTVSSSAGPPGHLAAENLDPAIQSFASMGQPTNTGAGKLCGLVTAASLAAIPIPSIFYQGTTACVNTTGSATYSAINSLLDVLVSGCKVLGGFEVAVNPLQPDTVDPNAPGAGAGPVVLVPNANHVAGCSAAGCMARDAYSVYFQFTTDRVIVK